MLNIHREDKRIVLAIPEIRDTHLCREDMHSLHLNFWIFPGLLFVYEITHME